MQSNDESNETPVDNTVTNIVGKHRFKWWATKQVCQFVGLFSEEGREDRVCPIRFKQCKISI